MSLIFPAKSGGQNLKTPIPPLKNTEKLTHNWTNYDNIAFYEGAALGDLQRYATISGLNSCCDIQLIKPYIFEKQTILEVGAGYGRVLNYFLECNFKGKLFAIERGIKFYHLLQEKFAHKAKIFHTDLNTFNTTEKFDVILWMWSGISDFPKEEQPKILSMLSTFLKQDGLIILDTLLPNKKLTNETWSNDQHYAIETEYGTAYGYKPSAKEIGKYAKKLGFHIKHFLEYKTPTNYKRNLHILFRTKFSRKVYFL